MAKQSGSKRQQASAKLSQQQHQPSQSHAWNSGLSGLNAFMAIQPHFGPTTGGRVAVPAAPLPLAQPESGSETRYSENQQPERKQTVGKVRIDKSNILLLGPTGSGGRLSLSVLCLCVCFLFAKIKKFLVLVYFWYFCALSRDWN